MAASGLSKEQPDVIVVGAENAALCAAISAHENGAKVLMLEAAKGFNEACQTDIEFNPTVKDGRGTEGFEINETNGANPLDTSPFHACHVTTGVTFTFGGLKVSEGAEAEDQYDGVIPGLYAAGEMVGGLFYNNYASGTG